MKDVLLATLIGVAAITAADPDEAMTHELEDWAAPDIETHFASIQTERDFMRRMSELDGVHHFDALVFMARHWCQSAQCSLTAYRSISGLVGTGPRTRFEALNEAYLALEDGLMAYDRQFVGSSGVVHLGSRYFLAQDLLKAAVDVGEVDTARRVLSGFPERDPDNQHQFVWERTWVEALEGREEEARALAVTAEAELWHHQDVTPPAPGTLTVDLIDTYLQPYPDVMDFSASLYQVVNYRFIAQALQPERACELAAPQQQDLQMMLLYQIDELERADSRLNNPAQVRILRRLALLEMLKGDREAAIRWNSRALNLQVPRERSPIDWPMELLAGQCIPDSDLWARRYLIPSVDPN